jgi:G3E family GTPase
MNEINSNNKQTDVTRNVSTTVCSELISKDNHHHHHHHHHHHDDDSSTASSSSSFSSSSQTNIQHKSNTTTTTSSSSFILTSSQIHETNALNLKEILQLFNCAISQEQAWAVLYQTLHGLKYLFKNNLELIKTNVDNIVINLLFLNKDGSVLFCFNTDVSGVSISDVSSLGECR